MRGARGVGVWGGGRLVKVVFVLNSLRGGRWVISGTECIHGAAHSEVRRSERPFEKHSMDQVETEEAIRPHRSVSLQGAASSLVQ